MRVVTTDDNQGPAAAKYILENLGKKKVYIIDSTDTFGKGIADNFQKYLEANGGTIVARDGAPKGTSDYSALMTAAAAKKPEAIYFGGVTADGGARILKAAVAAGMGDVPFVGPDGIYDGSGGHQGLVPEPGRRRRQELLRDGRRGRGLPRSRGLRQAVQGRVRHGSDRLQRDRLRLRAGRHRRPQPGGRRRPT